ncbi:MAG: hypothetical protein ACREXS_17615 [Gammaproteobacteria bacterium]
MTQTIVIKEPAPFYSQLDEDYFFRWLQDITKVKAVERTLVGLEILLDKPVDEECLADLAALLTRYSVDLKPMKALCAPNNEKWFRDPIMYWHQAVFGGEPKSHTE